MDMDVPEVLLSGDHAEIEKYRFLESVRETLERRPEMLEHVEFTAAELKLLKKTGMMDRITAAGRLRGE